MIWRLWKGLKARRANKAMREAMKLWADPDSRAQKEEHIFCRDCNKIHWDSDEIETFETRSAIGVVCDRHALWANRKSIDALMKFFEAQKGKGFHD